MSDYKMVALLYLFIHSDVLEIKSINSKKPTSCELVGFLSTYHPISLRRDRERVPSSYTAIYQQLSFRAQFSVHRIIHR